MEEQVIDTQDQQISFVNFVRKITIDNDGVIDNLALMYEHSRMTYDEWVQEFVKMVPPDVTVNYGK